MFLLYKTNILSHHFNLRFIFIRYSHANEWFSQISYYVSILFSLYYILNFTYFYSNYVSDQLKLNFKQKWLRWSIHEIIFCTRWSYFDLQSLIIRHHSRHIYLISFELKWCVFLKVIQFNTCTLSELTWYFYKSVSRFHVQFFRFETVDVHANFPGFPTGGGGWAPGGRLAVPAGVQCGASRGLTWGEACAQTAAAEGRGTEARAEPTGSSPARPVHRQIVGESWHPKVIVHKPRCELIPERRLIPERWFSKRVSRKSLPVSHSVKVSLCHARWVQRKFYQAFFFCRTNPN